MLLQLAYYATATVLILFTVLVAGQPFSLGLILDWTSVRGDNTIGWMLGLVWLLVGFVRYVLLLDSEHPMALASNKGKGVGDIADFDRPALD